jgi:DNA-binding transcriptional MerR regulator
MIATEPTLAELAAACGLLPRTVRSWVTQGLLPGPISRGPFARYPSDTLERVLAIRAMRDLLGMPLATIRQELLVATPEQIRAHAAKATGLAPEPAEPAVTPPAAGSGSALSYLQALRAGQVAPKPPPAAPMARMAPPPPLADAAPQAFAPTAYEAPTPGAFETLERRLAEGRTGKPPARKARAEEWLRIPVTPDVELAIRGPLDAEQRARLERCADLVRDILLGRDR